MLEMLPARLKSQGKRQPQEKSTSTTHTIQIAKPASQCPDRRDFKRDSHGPLVRVGSVGVPSAVVFTIHWTLARVGQLSTCWQLSSFLSQNADHPLRPAFRFFEGFAVKSTASVFHARAGHKSPASRSKVAARSKLGAAEMSPRRGAKGENLSGQKRRGLRGRKAK